MNSPVHSLTQTVARNLARWREERGLSLAELSRRTEPYSLIDKTALSRLERAATNPRPDGKPAPELRLAQLVALARALDVTPAWLVTPRVGAVLLDGDDRPLGKNRWRAWWSGDRALTGVPLNDADSELSAVYQDVSDAYEFAVSSGGYRGFMEHRLRLERTLANWERLAVSYDPNGPAVWQREQARAVEARAGRNAAGQPPE